MRESIHLDQRLSDHAPLTIGNDFKRCSLERGKAIGRPAQRVVASKAALATRPTRHHADLPPGVSVPA